MLKRYPSFLNCPHTLRWKVLKSFSQQKECAVARKQTFTVATNNFSQKTMADFWRKLLRIAWYITLLSWHMFLHSSIAFFLIHKVSANCNISIEFRLHYNFQQKNKVSFDSLSHSNCFIDIFVQILFQTSSIDSAQNKRLLKLNQWMWQYRRSKSQSNQPKWFLCDFIFNGNSFSELTCNDRHSV